MTNRKEYMKIYNEENKEYIAKQKKEYNKSNKEWLSAYWKEWYKNNKEHVSELHQKRYKENKEHISKRVKEYYEAKAKYLRDYKLSKGCQICGYNKCASALVFHHNGEKEFQISVAKKTLKQIKEEMKKCVVLCANCHNELHEKRRIIERGN